jgi:hypothetical protein
MRKLLPLLIVLAASPAFADNYGHVLSKSLDPDKARADATRDAQAGHCQLYGVQGYALTFPYAPSDTSGYRLIVIDDTSDVISPQTEKANGIGKAYADAYNATAVNICSARKS